MSTIAEQIKSAVAQWEAEEAKFAAGNKAAGTRARKALADLMKLSKQRRQEIQDAKSADAE
jgi:hypothetical protein